MESALRQLGSVGRLALMGGLIAGATAAARADTSLDGPAESIQVALADASVQEILIALKANYDVRFRSAVPLDRRMTGSFRAPLPRVVARVLDGYDYAIKSESGAIEVVVFADRGVGQPRSLGENSQRARYVSTPAQGEVPSVRKSQRLPPLLRPTGAVPSSPVIPGYSASSSPTPLPR